MEKPRMRIVSAAVTDKGLSDKRPVNEDSYLEMPERGLFAVADGVGGAQAGDFASQTAMEVLQQAFSHQQQNLETEELLEIAIQRANESIFQMSHELSQLEMMATTIVALHIENNVATVGHVGDSRLYRFDENGTLSRETRDHSMVEDEVKAGRMTSVQAANHPSRNVISRALGAEATVEVEMKTITFELGTTFLLCSDGVTRHLEDNEIRQVLERFASPRDVCSEIKSICYSRGAEDNLTALVIKAEDSATAISDDENTVTGIRPVFAPDPLPVLSNGDHPQGGRGADSTAARTDEFTSINVVHPDAATAPLESSVIDAAEATMLTSLKPASQTLGVTETPIDPAAFQPTLEPKLENERLRSKIDAAQPLETHQEPEERSSSNSLLRSLIILIVGVLVGAGGYYAWMLMSPPQTAAPTTQPANTIPPINSNNDLQPQEINEFRMYERVRRTVDAAPRAAQSRFQDLSNGTAADYYLRGRAFLMLGETANARKDFISAADQLANGNAGGVNQETLKFDIAIAEAAVGAISLTREDRRSLEDIVKTKQEGSADLNPVQPTR